MREEIKELCIFMICGQTLLYFQSGKKYEKICRMILELLVLAGIVGMILNFLQSIGIQKGEMQALGGAVAGMQRSMEEAVGRQLDTEGIGEDFISGISMESLVEKYTMEEVKRQYSYFAGQYGFEIEKAEQAGDRLRVYVRESRAQEEEGSAGKGRDAGETAGREGSAGIENQAESAGKETGAGNQTGKAERAEIQPIEIQKIETEKISLGDNAEVDEPNKITNGLSETDESNKMSNETPEKTHEESMSGSTDASEIAENQLETFRRQFALVLAMEEEKLEVILID